MSAEDRTLSEALESLALGDPPRLGQLGRREGSPCFLLEPVQNSGCHFTGASSSHHTPHLAVERAFPPTAPSKASPYPHPPPRVLCGKRGDSVLEIQIYFSLFSET